MINEVSSYKNANFVHIDKVLLLKFYFCNTNYNFLSKISTKTKKLYNFPHNIVILPFNMAIFAF